MKLVETLKFYLNKVKDAISSAKEIAAKNKKELIRGSVLDPMNHPSNSK